MHAARAQVPGLLEQWLGRSQLHEFLREHLHQRAFAAPDAARSAAERCGWHVVDALLGSPEADTLVIARGVVDPHAPPRSLDALRELFGCGVGVAVRRADRASEGVAALAEQLRLDVPGEQRVIVFATPRDSYGFGWHFDVEEVFVVQTAGAKTYYFRANTVSRRPLHADAASFADYARETSALHAVRLHAGDWLYLPSGTWHAAYAHADALSVSIGVLSSVERGGQPRSRLACAASHSVQPEPRAHRNTSGSACKCSSATSTTSRARARRA
jgi:hypothetical protein